MGGGHSAHYILFLDSDDIIQINAIEKIVAIFLQYSDIDGILYNSIFHFDDNTKNTYIKEEVFLPKKFEHSIFSPLQILEQYNIWLHSVYLLVVKCNILKNNSNCRFIPKLLHEDHLFATSVFLSLGKLYIDSMPFYYYRINRPNSIMNIAKLNKNLISTANNYYLNAKHFDSLCKKSNSDLIKIYYQRGARYFTLECLKCLQYIGYSSDIKFNKNDLGELLEYIKGKRKFCYYFPRIYGFPKKISKWIILHIKKIASLFKH